MSSLGEVVARELTPHGCGGVAVVELSGAGALERARELARGAALELGALQLARLELGGDALDEALIWAEHAARVELHVHASPPLVRRLLERFASATERAQSLEERARVLLGSAPSETGARILLDQAEGALSRALAAWSRLDAHSARRELEHALERSRCARFALQPARVVLAGPVNAGKSTLFNALFGRQRVLVSERPGTTRDGVVERARLGLWPIELCDTAGERALDGAASERAGALERAAQDLARALRTSADLVLWLAPADGADTVPEPTGALRVIESRADLAPARVGGRPRIAALADPRGAAEVVRAEFERAFALPARFWRAGEPLAFDAASRELLAALARGAQITRPR